LFQIYRRQKILLFSIANPLFFKIYARVTTVAIAANIKNKHINRYTAAMKY
jgi:hypothetical protein